MTEILTALHPAFTLEAFTDLEFWTSVGVIAGIYVVFSTGLQMNVGFTGIQNFGQVGFMAIGAYTMAILIADTGMNFWLSLPVAVAVAIAFGLLIGLPSLRLRADYFAIATIAFAEAIRLVAQNARDLTGGPQGIFGFDDSWNSVSDDDRELHRRPRLDRRPVPVPALPRRLGGGDLPDVRRSRGSSGRRGGACCAPCARTRTRRARSARTRSPTSCSRWRSPRRPGALAGFLLALNLKFVVPDEFQPLVTFTGYVVLILGGLANYWGVAFGAIILWTVLEGLRFLELPLSETKIAALRFIILGLVLIGLMAFRPQGIFGKREEMVLGD